MAGSVICGEKKTGVGAFGREGSDLEYYNEEIIKKSAKTAFEISKIRRNTVSSIDKSNVLASSMLWKEVVKEVSKDHPNVKLKHHLVDTAAMEVMINPEKFDVIVTTNMFGDILADELSQITGSAYMLPSAEIDELSVETLIQQKEELEKEIQETTEAIHSLQKELEESKQINLFVVYYHNFIS